MNLKEVFQDELPDGLPHERTLDHSIEIQGDSKPLHLPLFQLSPAECQACEVYVESLLKYGAFFFFVEEGGKSGGFFNYRAMN